MKKIENKQDFSNQIKLQIPSHPKYSANVRNFIFQIARDEGFSYYDAADIKLITGEAIHYIMDLACENKTNLPIFIEITLYPAKMEIRIRDFGKKLEESRLKGFDLSDYRSGGLGMFIIKNIADHFYLDTALETGNQMIITKLK